MANDLTGEFDVVAEFAIPAANRVLAAMHRAERFLHAMSLNVEDVHAPGRHFGEPSIVAVIDEFGDPAVDHGRFPVRPPGGVISTGGTSSSRFDAIINHLGDLVLAPLEPSQLKGRAQIQLAPPTIEVADNSGKNVTIRMPLMSRYLPEPNTPPVAEFIRGNVGITAGISEVASQVGNVVAIDIKGHAVSSSFNVAWSNTPISAQDMAGVNLLIRNAIRTSFLPSNAALPSDIAHVRFKTMRGSQDALAVLLNMSGSAGNPATQNNVFLGGGDDFAFAAGSDFIRREMQPTIDKIMNTPIDPVSFTLNGLVHTWHITYTFTLNSVTVDLTNGNIVLTIKGHAHTGSWTPDFDFTVKQKFTLTPVGSTAELEIGDLSLDTSSWIIDRFRGKAESAMKRVRDKSLSQSHAQDTVRKALDADKKLGGLLASLLKPAKPEPGVAPPKGYTLAYTSAEIRTSGIVLHGTVAVSEWPAPHVEYEKITPSATTGPLGGLPGTVGDGPDYSALKSWIPGGIIQRYEWKRFGQSQPLHIDDNRFVFPHPPPEFTEASASTTPVAAFLPLCVTVKGTRLSASGPVQPVSVTASGCGFNSFPVFGVEAIGVSGLAPMIALTHADNGGGIHVAGHTVARAAGAPGAVPNMIVHFADDQTIGKLDQLSRGLKQSGRDDSSTGILAVVTPEQLSKARHESGIVYSDDDPKVWARAYRLDGVRTPLTIIVDPSGKVVWKQEGAIDSAALAEALRRVLVAGEGVKLSFLRPSARAGQLPPNFLFQHAPGNSLTLRKIAGKPTAMVFWRSTSRASIDTVRDWQRMRPAIKRRDYLVLAINDGEPPEIAKRAAAENGLTATIVPDWDRKISRAYGVSIWPTVIQLDERGLVTNVTQGHSDANASDSRRGSSKESGV